MEGPVDLKEVFELVWFDKTKGRLKIEIGFNDVVDLVVMTITTITIVGGFGEREGAATELNSKRKNFTGVWTASHLESVQKGLHILKVGYNSHVIDGITRQENKGLELVRVGPIIHHWNSWTKFGWVGKERRIEKLGRRKRKRHDGGGAFSHLR